MIEQAKPIIILIIAMSMTFCMGYWYQGYSIYKNIIGGYVDIMPKLDKK